MIDRRGSFLCCLLIATVLFVVGCAAPQSVSVTVLSAERIQVGRKTVTLSELPQALDALGAKPSTEIVVHTPAESSRMVLGSVSSTLASSGYRKIMFRGPRRVESYTETR